MDKQPSAEKITFDLFLDAIKRKDKMQFSYFSLYFAIKNAEQFEQKDNLQSQRSTCSDLQTEELAF